MSKIMKRLFILLSFILICCQNEENAVKPPIVKIGDVYQGGIVFYILQSGDYNYIEGEQHGLISSENDQSVSIKWGCSTPIFSQFLEGIGYGEHNTQLIVDGCPGDNAASLCNSLSLNGYDDWWLPNVEEFEKMIVNKLLLNFQLDKYYWTSFMGNPSEIISIRPSDGNTQWSAPANLYRVRAIRRF